MAVSAGVSVQPDWVMYILGQVGSARAAAAVEGHVVVHSTSWRRLRQAEGKNTENCSENDFFRPNLPFLCSAVEELKVGDSRSLDSD